MLAEMRPSELATYWAMFRMDPWDEARSDLRAGIVASTIAQWAGKTMAPGSETPKASDYLLKFDSHSVEQEKKDDLSKKLKAFLMGRTVKKG